MIMMFVLMVFMMIMGLMMLKSGTNLEWSWPLIDVLKILLVVLEKKLVGNLSLFT